MPFVEPRRLSAVLQGGFRFVGRLSCEDRDKRAQCSGKHSASLHEFSVVKSVVAVVGSEELFAANVFARKTFQQTTNS